MSRFRAVPALLLLSLAGCKGDADFSEAAPKPVTLSAEKHRQALIEDDRSWSDRNAADLEIPKASPSPVSSETLAAVARLTAEMKPEGAHKPGLARLVSVGERLLPYGAAARPAAAPLANWLRYYSLWAVEQDREALLKRLGAIVRALDPDASYYGDRRFQYGRDKGDQDRARAVAFLLYGPLPKERAVPVFRAAMADPEDWIKDLAAAGLASCGEPVPPDPRTLTERLLANSERMTNEATAEVRSLAPPAKAQVIRSLLASGNPRDASAAGALYYYLRDPLIGTTILDSLGDPATRKSALVAFGHELPLPADRVPSLIAAMGDPRPEVRDEARSVLLRKGPSPRILVPALISAVSSGPAAQRESAAAALKEITGRDYGTDAGKWRLWREAKIEGEPPQLLLPGPHHGDEVPLNADGVWWSICDANGSRELKQVVVAVRLVNDPVLDDESRTTGAEAEVRGCDSPIALLRNVPGLKARVLTEGTASPVRKGVSTLRFGKTDLEVRRFPEGERGFRLELSSQGRTQTLFATEAGLLGESEPWKIAWIGDLDGDGKADLLLDATDDENVGQAFLFLSGPADAGTLLKLVATYRIVGC